MSYRAKDFMSRNFVTFAPDMDVLEAVRMITDLNISGGPVVDNQGNLVGVLSEIDCVRAVIQASYHESRGGLVKEFMRSDFKTVDVDDSIMHVAKLFGEQSHFYYRGFPVLKHSRVVGRITLRNVLRAFDVMSQEARKGGR